ncbi:MAG TPA: polyprenyl synthetase family protein [Polyangiaceae bacterium]|nr:polyprenyl synthetase family protein [Polyangiaceae bacterium]
MQAAPPVADRLAAVQALLADDLAWIEATLGAVSSEGPAPGSAAARHLLSSGGKRIRPIALLLSAACFGVVPPVARELAVVAELVHSATLLHDDVIDDGDARRGVPAARKVWGNAVSVLAGDLLLVHALERTARLAPDAMPDLVSTLRSLVDGEIVQLRGRTELDVSESTYERILRDKTASLFAWATRTGARVAGATPHQQELLARFGERLGIAFQLVDDVIDYAGEGTGKTLLIDLREGKLTLPLVLAVAKHPELVVALRRIHAGDAEPVAFVSRVVRESGACDVVRERARECTRAGLDALAGLPPTPARLVLERVATELVSRAS